MDYNKHILLISYSFPPYPGIGGRRWAKFAKHLTELNFTVHVIHAANPFSEKSLWLDDVANNEKIIHYTIKSRYPKILLIEPKTFLEKLHYKIALGLIKLTTKGTPYDRGVFCKKDILRKSKLLLEKWGIKNVIVSCAPFSSAYYSILLKEKYKHINFLLDLRDPWTWGSGYGFKQLSTSRFKFEQKKEKLALTEFDGIFVPSVEMKNELNSIYNFSFSSKIHELPHAYDEDEITKNNKIKSQEIRLIFYGSLYTNLETAFRNIASFIRSNQSTVLDIYSSSKTYASIFESENLLSNRVTYNGSKMPKELFKIMADYDGVLVVQPDYAKDFITTKIYEIIYSGIPITLISKPGKLSEFILTNKIGLWHNSENDLSDLDLNQLHEFRHTNFNIEAYSFRHVTKQLTNFFKC